MTPSVFARMISEAIETCHFALSLMSTGQSAREGQLVLYIIFRHQELRGELVGFRFDDLAADLIRRVHYQVTRARGPRQNAIDRDVPLSAPSAMNGPARKGDAECVYVVHADIGIG